MTTTDGEQSYELSHQYLVDDFPSKYRDLVLTEMKNNEEFTLKTVHEVFQSGNYKGKRVLEVGCGPTIHRLATPSKYYDEIITGDYVSGNRESVKKWLAGDPNALDWTPLLKVVAACEGFSDLSSGIKEIEARMRRKVKSVVHCDVLKKSIFEPAVEDVDLLITAGCLEGACPSLESFASAVKNLGSFVKPGGHILMLTAIHMASAEFDGKEMKVLSVDEDFVHNSLKEAGFVPEKRFFRENDFPSITFDGSLIVIARKQ